MLDSECVHDLRVIPDDPHNLRVRFPDGSIFGYQYVPRDVVGYLLAAGSVGKAYNAVIRGAYRSIRLRRIDQRTTEQPDALPHP